MPEQGDHVTFCFWPVIDVEPTTSPRQQCLQCKMLKFAIEHITGCNTRERILGIEGGSMFPTGCCNT